MPWVYASGFTQKGFLGRIVMKKETNMARLLRKS